MEWNCYFILGAADPSALTESSLSNLSQTEVGLTLTNKFEFASLSMIKAGAFDTDKLFVKTKQLITSVLPCTKESNLLGCLKSKTSGEEAEKYWRLVELKEQVEKTAENNRSMLEHTNLFQVRFGLVWFQIKFSVMYNFIFRMMNVLFRWKKQRDKFSRTCKFWNDMGELQRKMDFKQSLQP